MKEEKVLNCYECGNVCHLRNECPELDKPKGKSNSFEKSRGRRSYIAWEDDDTSFAPNDSQSDEVVHLCFIGHKKNRNELTYFDTGSKFNSSYEELQQALVDMHGDACDEYF
jgi:hypothetical protein